VVNYECKLTLLGGDKVVYVDNINSGDVFEGTVDADPLHAATTSWLTKAVYDDAAAAGLCTGDALKLLGRHLYEKVFRGEIDKTFRETFARFEADDDETLKLVLEFADEAEDDLAELPWEFLYLEKSARKGAFLAGQDHSLVLTRVVPKMAERANVLTRVKLLLAICTPQTQAAGSTDDLVRVLAKAATVDLTTLEDPAYSDLKKAIEATNPDIVHIVCHGEPGKLKMRRESAKVQEAELERRLASSMGGTPPPVEQVEDVRVSKTTDLFAAHKPRLVFLQTCYGNAVEGDVLSSTALEVARADVPAVVAMQYTIQAEDADRFATAFYDQLLGGATIGQAVWHGRKKLAVREGEAWAHRNFGTPVVYVKDTRVVDPQPEQAGQGSDQSATTLTACLRCDFKTRYRTCPRCRFEFDCQNPKCGVPYEALEGFCGKCKFEFKQQPWSPEPVAPPAPVKPLVQVMGPDDFEKAS
jgi:hypothetical protein